MIPDHLEGDLGLERVGWASALLLPAAALIFLSFNAGGYFPSAPAFVAIMVVQAIVVRTMAARRPYAGINGRLAVPIVALALLAAWQLASALWSHSTARSLDEFDRTLLYLLVFVLFGSMVGGIVHIRWLVRGLAAAMAAVCLISLVSRLLPEVWPTAIGFAADRLSYPLTYWNAEGLLAGIAVILTFHLACAAREARAVRVVAAALLPAIASTLLLTFSRGAIAVSVLGLLVYASLARPRGLLAGLTSVVLPVAVALHASYEATRLSSAYPTSPSAVSQGRDVAVVVGACMLGSGVFRALLLRLDDWIAFRRLSGRRISRRIRAGGVAVASAAAVAGLLAADAPGYIQREYSRFISNGTSAGGHLTRDRLTDLANDGRLPLWRVGIRAFRAQPFHGQGAGTFQLYFAQHRPSDATVADAHSLYVQVLAELGIVGLVLVLIAVLGILALLAVRIRGPDRAVYAALFAASLAWTVHAGIDWDWQMPAVTLWLFAAGGLALGRRPEESPRVSAVATWDRVTVGAAWLAVAVTPFLVTLSFQRVQSAGHALTQLDCAAARREALASLSFDALRPQPYAIIGFCDVRQGLGPSAVAAMDKAVSEEPANWEFYYGLGIARAEDGLDPRPALARAQALNPFEWIVSSASSAFAGAPVAKWPQIAPAVSFQGMESGELNNL